MTRWLCSCSFVKSPRFIKKNGKSGHRLIKLKQVEPLNMFKKTCPNFKLNTHHKVELVCQKYDFESIVISEAIYSFHLCEKNLLDDAVF